MCWPTTMVPNQSYWPWHPPHLHRALLELLSNLLLIMTNFSHSKNQKVLSSLLLLHLHLAEGHRLFLHSICPYIICVMEKTLVDFGHWVKHQKTSSDSLNWDKHPIRGQEAAAVTHFQQPRTTRAFALLIFSSSATSSPSSSSFFKWHSRTKIRWSGVGRRAIDWHSLDLFSASTLLCVTALGHLKGALFSVTNNIARRWAYCEWRILVLVAHQTPSRTHHHWTWLEALLPDSILCSARLLATLTTSSHQQPLAATGKWSTSHLRWAN